VKAALLAMTLITISPAEAIGAGTIYVAARPVAAPLPDVPEDGGGWVHVSFVVQADGTVGDVIALDSGGNPAVEKSAIETISGWKFEPARIDGVPVDQRINDRLVVLSPTPVDPRTNRRLIRVFEAADELIQSDKLDAAEMLLIRTRDDFSLTYYAWYRIHALLAKVAARRGDKEEQVNNLLIALPYAAWERVNMLHTLFGLQVELKMYRAALATYGELKGYGAAVISPKLAGVASELNDLVAGTEGFRVNGEIRSRGSGSANSTWHHDILRQRIAFDQVEGSLDSFEVRCATHSFADKVDTEREWTLPDAWGPCMLMVVGQPGSSFRLLQMPAADGPEAAPR